jgi:predicted nicotinamide N-methyase
MTGYAVKHEDIGIAGAANLNIRSLLDRQQFSDPLGEALRLGISSAAWPLFGLLWPSGRQLAARMALRPVIAGERILEVGCGLGLASLVCHRRGADITASDCHPLAAAFMLENVRLNALPPLPYRHGHWAAEPGDPAPENTPQLLRVQGRFDLVIGSDLLYERDDGGTLSRFIERHAQTRSQVWIVDPNRGNRTPFNRQMQALGFDRREERLDTPAHDDVAAYRGRVLIYER